MKNEEFEMIIEITGLDEVLSDFDKFVKVNHIATRRALNRIGTQARNVSLRSVKADDKWNINMKTLKGVSRPIKATNNNLNYIFEMSSSSIQLHKWSGTTYFGATTKGGKRRNASRVGVKFKLKTNKPKKTLKRSFMRRSLFGAKENIVFTRRKSPKGAEITAQSSITPTSMFQQTGEERFVDVFMTKFTDRYIHELKNLKAI